MISKLKNIVTFWMRSGKYNVTPVGVITAKNNWAWNIDLSLLGPTSVVLSGGVGHNISFELELVRMTGAKIHLFDPSPTGRMTIDDLKGAKELENIRFIPKALGGVCGNVSLESPDDPDEGSWKCSTIGARPSSILVESVTLSQYCRSISATKIDLLKMDIEGAEYDVLDDVFSNNLDVAQICLEFHCHAQIGIRQTYFHIFLYLLKLWFRGYRIVHITKSDFTLIRK